jgi:hypothetical protein
MRTIEASEFKAKGLKIMDEVAATREPVLVTKNGVPLRNSSRPSASQKLSLGRSRVLSPLKVTSSLQ